jgi:hypothetical protein
MISTRSSASYHNISQTFSCVLRTQVCLLRRPGHHVHHHHGGGHIDHSYCRFVGQRAIPIRSSSKSLQTLFTFARLIQWWRYCALHGFLYHSTLLIYCLRIFKSFLKSAEHKNEFAANQMCVIKYRSANPSPRKYYLNPVPRFEWLKKSLDGRVR